MQSFIDFHTLCLCPCNEHLKCLNYGKKSYTPVFPKVLKDVFNYFDRTTLSELKMVDKFILYSSCD